MQPFDAEAVVAAARTSPAQTWTVFPWLRVVAVVWLVKRLLSAVVVTVIAAIAVLALEWVAIDDPKLPLLLVGLWVLSSVVLGFGPLRALATAGKNLLVVTEAGVAWREGPRVRGFSFDGLVQVRQRITAGRGLEHEVELVYSRGPVLFLDHRRFGPPGEVASAVARQAGVAREEVHGRVDTL